MSNPNNSHLAHNQGYTLLELLITLSIAAVLLLITISSWKNWIAFHQEKIYANQIITALRFARTQAILNNVSVIYCASSDGENCGKQWNDGQIIKTTNNQLLRVFSASPKALRLKWQSSFTLDDFIQFSPNGFTVDQQGSFYICAKSQKDGFRIRVIRSGRVLVEDYHCS